MKKFDWFVEFSPKQLVEDCGESEYDVQAEEFAKKHGIKLYLLAKTRDTYFPDDRDARWIYKMQLTRGRESYTFTFGQSIAAGDTVPSYYDVFSSMTKYDPGSFHDFCEDYGYDEFNEDGWGNSRSAMIYKNVLKEYEAMERLFGDVMDEFAEIQ